MKKIPKQKPKTEREVNAAAPRALRSFVNPSNFELVFVVMKERRREI